MKTKISGVYKITNNITGDFYIGSSVNIKHRWAKHRCPSTWKNCPNNPLYLDMQKYQLDNFTFEIVEETSQLKKREQYFIDLLQPNYNNYRANGLDIERYKECHKEWSKAHPDYGKEWNEANLVYKKEWYEAHRDETLTKSKEYGNRRCIYNGETLTLNALSLRFRRWGILHPTLEAKKYLLGE